MTSRSEDLKAQVCNGLCDNGCPFDDERASTACFIAEEASNVEAYEITDYTVKLLDEKIRFMGMTGCLARADGFHSPEEVVGLELVSDQPQEQLATVIPFPIRKEN